MYFIIGINLKTAECADARIQQEPEVLLGISSCM